MLELFLCSSDLCAGLDLHNHMETCRPWGGGPAGPGDHCGENLWSTQQEGSTTVWLWPSTGETGGPQSPNFAIAYEGKFKKGIHLYLSVFFHFSSLCLLLALHVPAAVSSAAADGELPGQDRAVPGQVAALCNQTLSLHSTVGDPEPHRTHGVRTIVNYLLPNLIYSILKLVSLSFRYAGGQMSNNGSSILWCHIYTKILCSAWLDYPDCSTHKLPVLRRASFWETLLWQDSWH